MKSIFNREQDKKIKRRYLDGETAEQIALSYSTYKQSVLNSLKRTKTPRRQSWLRANGAKNANWRGGVRWIKGYKHLLMPNHHLARADGYVAEHRLLAEQLIGRQLLSNEVVNHKDRDTTNNQIGNLEVFDNNGEHIAMHVRTSFNRIERGRWGIVQ